MTRTRGASLLFIALVPVTSGCNLNPQPLPPELLPASFGQDAAALTSDEGGGAPAGSFATDASAAVLSRGDDASPGDNGGLIDGQASPAPPQKDSSTGDAGRTADAEISEAGAVDRESPEASHPAERDAPTRDSRDAAVSGGD